MKGSNLLDKYDESKYLPVRPFPSKNGWAFSNIKWVMIAFSNVTRSSLFIKMMSCSKAVSISASSIGGIWTACEPVPINANEFLNRLPSGNFSGGISPFNNSS